MSFDMQRLLYPYLAPVGDKDGGAGAAADRGDDFTPTDDDAAPAAPEAKAEPKAKAVEVDKAEPEVDKDEGKDELTDEERKQAKYVPRERLADVTRKARAKEEAYQAEIKRLNEALQANKIDENIEQIDAKIAELDDKYDDLIQEGEKEKAKAVKLELRKYEKARSEMVSRAYSVQAQLSAIEQYRYDNALDALEQQYDVLNEASDEFDPDKTQEIADLMQFHQSKGMSKADALRKAALTLLGPPKAKEAQPDGNALKAQRSADARKKALDATGKQPPDISKVGVDSDKIGGGKLQPRDLMKMSQDQFAKLDEETLRTLRGDDFVGEAA